MFIVFKYFCGIGSIEVNGLFLFIVVDIFIVENRVIIGIIWGMYFYFYKVFSKSKVIIGVGKLYVIVGY